MHLKINQAYSTFEGEKIDFIEKKGDKGKVILGEKFIKSGKKMAYKPLFNNTFWTLLMLNFIFTKL